MNRPSPVTVLGALASFIVMGVFWGAWAALVPEIQRRTGASDPELGAALLCAGAGALPAMLLTGRLWARFGRRLVPATLVLFGAVAAGPALAGSVVALALAVALVGAASGALDVAMNAQISDAESKSGRRLMFLAHALFSLAVLVASVSVGLLRGLAVEPLPVLGSVAAAFFVVAAYATLGGDRRVREPAAAQPIPAPVPADGMPAQLVIAGRLMVILGLLCAGAFLIEDALVSWSALHLERSLGASPAIGGAGPGLFAGAMFVGRSLGQVVGRRFSDRAILVGGGIMAGLGIVAVAVAPSAVVALAGLLVAGIGVSLIAPALFGRAGRAAGDRSRGAAIARLTVFGYLGFVVGPPIVGLIAGLTDLRVSFFALAALAATLAVVAWLVLGGDERRRPIEDLPPVARG